MSTPVHELPQPIFNPLHAASSSSGDNGTYVGEGSGSFENDRHHLNLQTHQAAGEYYLSPLSPSRTREQEHRLDDDLAVAQAEQVASNVQTSEGRSHVISPALIHRSRSRRTDPVDDFDVATNPIHEKTSGYKPPDHPSTNFAKFFKRIHNSSVLVRYFTYIVPVVTLLLIPLLLGALVFKDASVGGVTLTWFAVWLEIDFLTLFAGRIVAKCIPWPMGLVSSLFTNNSKKWRDMGKQLEIPATIFFWWLGIEISFLPTMTNHHTNGNNGIKPWEATMNKIIVSIFVGTTLNLFEKVIIQLIAISFHLRTYSDRIEINKFQIGSLTKLYQYSKQRIAMDDSEFEEDGPSKPASGARTPAQYLDKAQRNAREALNAVTDVAGKVAMDFTGKNVLKSTHPQQVILTLLNTTKGSQVLARRLYRTFVREGEETVSSDDLKDAFDNNEEADAAFTMFDKDMNGDISMEELEAVCVEIGRERKSITASLKDLDSVVSKLDSVLFFIVVIIAILVLISLVSTSAAGVLTSLGSTVLGLAWLFSATAQEFLQSVVFVFVKHPFDVGDRVTVYGNTGVLGKGDDYFVKEIALLYTEFKKLEGHVVQAPNSYLNTLFILNQRRSGGLAEAIPMIFKFGTTLDQIDQLRQCLLEFVKNEKREYQSNILTEIREVTEAHSMTVNVVFFYKSNWQNELLRLQRRNKFICALMVSMQELGIEGPRMRLPGQKQESPYYLQHVTPEAPPSATSLEGGPGPRSGSLSREAPFVPNAADEPAVGRNPSILRHAPSTSRATRARGESLSAMSRRVDFSLGMRDVSSSDILSDVYDDRSKSRVPDFNRPTVSNRDHNKSVTSDTDSIARTTSQDVDAASRYSADSQNRPRASHSAIQRNRFFGRKRGFSKTGADQELMEQGMADIPEAAEGSRHTVPRTGAVSATAMRSNTNPSTSDEPIARNSSKGIGGFFRRSWTDDFEMRDPNIFHRSPSLPSASAVLPRSSIRQPQMDALKGSVNDIILNPQYAEYLALVKAARNGAVYGAKVRFPHALVMVFLFRSGTFREKLRLIIKATRQHARNLATFAVLYKSTLLALRHLPTFSPPSASSSSSTHPSSSSFGLGPARKEGRYDTFIAGLVGGYAVFGRGRAAQSSVNQQIVIYVFARVVLALAKLSVQPGGLFRGVVEVVDGGVAGSGGGKESAGGGREGGGGMVGRNAWPVFASLSWAFVMWLFRWYPETLQASLRSSMKYIYVNADHWDGFRNFLWHNR